MLANPAENQPTETQKSPFFKVPGELVHDGRHDVGYATETVRTTLCAGENEIRIKLANFDNFQWRLWTFSLTARPM